MISSEVVKTSSRRRWREQTTQNACSLTVDAYIPRSNDGHLGRLFRADDETDASRREPALPGRRAPELATAGERDGEVPRFAKSASGR